MFGPKVQRLGGFVATIYTQLLEALRLCQGAPSEGIYISVVVIPQV